MRFRSFVALAGFALLASLATAQPKFLHPDRIRYDGHCFTIDGKDTFLFSGAFHYFRCPKELWRNRFQKIKAAGFNAVETYVAWNWSERSKPRDVSDFSQIDLKDLDAWLTMAEDEFGLYTIVRPGPYICSEWASGGFPNWLQTFRPAKTKRDDWYRSDDPVFEAWSHHWMEAVAKVVGKHQLTRKPAGKKGVILWQVENEYDYASMPEDAKRNYVRYLIASSLNLGIEVPIFGCWTSPIRYPKGDPILSQAFDNPNEYNRWNIESVIGALSDQHKAQPWAPKMVTEFQGGWFGGVGGEAAVEQDGIDTVQTSSHTLLAIANGLTGLNYYMLFGGTNFGDWAAQGITTSYDYAAPIREWGGTGDKYHAVQVIGRMLQQVGSDLARSEAVSPPDTTGAKVKPYARRGASGAKYVFLWNPDRQHRASGVLGEEVGFDLAPFATAVYRYKTDLQSGGWLITGNTPSGNGPASPEKGIRLKEATVAFGTPSGWQKVVEGKASTTDLGVWDSRPIFYKFGAPKAPSDYLWLQLAKEGEIYAPELPQPQVRQGGLAWKGGSGVAVLFNPGWPNGGPGMEKPRGILEAKEIADLPEGRTLTSWVSKRLVDDSDLSSVAADVDTTGWDPDANPSRYPEHTSVVARSVVTLDKEPDPKTLLVTDGVDDYGDFYVNGKWVGHLSSYGIPGSFPAGKVLHRGRNVIAVIIHNNEGAGGFVGSTALEMPLPRSHPAVLQWTTKAQFGKPTRYGLQPGGFLPLYEHPHFRGERMKGQALVVRSTVTFQHPGRGAWQIVLKAGGDGFLTLNGHALGRYWEVGPQRGYYLPESWLEKSNVLEYLAIPGRMGDRLSAAELRHL